MELVERQFRAGQFRKDRVSVSVSRRCVSVSGQVCPSQCRCRHREAGGARSGSAELDPTRKEACMGRRGVWAVGEQGPAV